MLLKVEEQLKRDGKHLEHSDEIQVRSDQRRGANDIFVPKHFTKADLL